MPSSQKYIEWYLLKAMKASLESVQGTLITSVRLIQDQLDQFSTQMTSAIDSRMGQMEAKLERFETSMKKLDERSEGWSAMQHHILSWGDQMISLDSKVRRLKFIYSWEATKFDKISILTLVFCNVKTKGQLISEFKMEILSNFVGFSIRLEVSEVLTYPS